MLLLFLDTETTGVELSKCQIIEIGAVIYELNTTNFELTFVNQFQSTIALRQKMESKITRITGITTEELETAKSLLQVQNSWINWLESQTKISGNIDSIVGHSIDFDLDFLKKEGWYLPTKNKTDTLDIAKIIYPNLSAINLEYLSKKLNFETDNFDKVILSESSHHRSLFDSLMCANLFKHLIQKINSNSFPTKFLEDLSQRYFLNLHFYNSQNPENLESKDKQKLQDETTISGQKKLTINQKLDFLNQQSLQILLESLEWNWSKENKNSHLTLMQIISCNLHKILGFEDLKLHTQGINHTADIILDWCINLDLSVKGRFLINNFEKIIENISSLVDNHCNLGEIINLLELIQEIEPKIQIQNIVSQYSFLLIGIKTNTKNFVTQLDIDNLTYKDRIIAHKFFQIIKDIKNIQWQNSNNSQSLSSFFLIIEKKIKLSLNLINIENGIIHLRTVGNDIHLTSTKTNFNLNDYLVDLENSNQIQINLDSTLSKKMCYLLGANLHVENWHKLSTNYQSKVTNKVNAKNFLEDKIELSISKKKPIIIFCGLNSSMIKIQKVADENNFMNKILILGESGGITKISSKIEQGFVGIVVVKFSSVDFFINQIVSFEEVIIYDRPFLGVHYWWQKKARESKNHDEFISELRDLYLQGKINYLNQKFNCNVEFVYNLL
jgi:DNA polymerase III epsilon subunit-like protein